MKYYELEISKEQTDFVNKYHEVMYLIEYRFECLAMALRWCTACAFDYFDDEDMAVFSGDESNYYCDEDTEKHHVYRLPASYFFVSEEEFFEKIIPFHKNQRKSIQEEEQERQKEEEEKERQEYERLKRKFEDASN